MTPVQAATLNKMLPKGTKVLDADAPKDAQDFGFDSEDEGFIYIGKDMPTSRQAQIMENKHREEKLRRKEAYRKMTAVDPGRKKAFNHNSAKKENYQGKKEIGRSDKRQYKASPWQFGYSVRNKDGLPNSFDNSLPNDTNSVEADANEQ